MANCGHVDHVHVGGLRGGSRACAYCTRGAAGRRLSGGTDYMVAGTSPATWFHGVGRECVEAARTGAREGERKAPGCAQAHQEREEANGEVGGGQTAT